MKTVSIEEVNKMHLGLPKWPQMIIVGDKVDDPELVKEIIWRTDRFLTDFSEHSGGNERQFNRMFRISSGFEKITGDLEPWDKYELMEEFRLSMGYIALTYVPSSFASSSNIIGPHGFISPSGEMHYTANVGKWPSIEEIYNDLVKITTAFPALNFKCALYNGEECEDDTEQVIGFVVHGGVVSITRDDLGLAEDQPAIDYTSLFGQLMGTPPGAMPRELGLPWEWYESISNRNNFMLGTLLEELEKNKESE